MSEKKMNTHFKKNDPMHHLCAAEAAALEPVMDDPDALRLMEIHRCTCETCARGELCKKQIDDLVRLARRKLEAAEKKWREHAEACPCCTVDTPDPACAGGKIPYEEWRWRFNIRERERFHRRRFEDGPPIPSFEDVLQERMATKSDDELEQIDAEGRSRNGGGEYHRAARAELDRRSNVPGMPEVEHAEIR